MRQVTIMGFPFLHTDQQSFHTLLDQRIEQQQKTFVITANPEIVMQAREDQRLMRVVDRATYIIADGIGIVKASHILNKPLPERVTGYDTMIKLLSLANKKQYTVFLLGATKHTLELTKNNIRSTYPNVEIVGSHDGYFDSDNNTIAEEIAEVQPDIVLVALGVPKQEKWIADNLDKFDKGIFIGVGGSFDVLAGTVKRAPISWQRLNLEWFYRLLQQPSRWRRMNVLPRFLIEVFKEKWKFNKG